MQRQYLTGRWMVDIQTTGDRLVMITVSQGGALGDWRSVLPNGRY